VHIPSGRPSRALSTYGTGLPGAGAWLLPGRPNGARFFGFRLGYFLLSTALLLTPILTHPLGEFLPAGMAEVYTALASNAEGLFWNSASVAHGYPLSISVCYDQPFEISELETVSGAVLIREGRVGIGLAHQDHLN